MCELIVNVKVISCPLLRGYDLIIYMKCRLPYKSNCHKYTYVCVCIYIYIYIYI